MMSGWTSGADGNGSRMPHVTSAISSPGFQARITSGLSLPSMTGRASPKPSEASRSIRGIGSSSCPIGQKPETQPGASRPVKPSPKSRMASDAAGPCFSNASLRIAFCCLRRALFSDLRADCALDVSVIPCSRPEPGAVQPGSRPLA